MTETSTEGTPAEVSLREITAETVVTICRLSETLVEPQKRMVAPNAISIAQAHFSKHAWFRAIYADDEPVGFIMLYDNPDEPTYFLWRLMVAVPHQGKGYGRKAIEHLIEYVKTRQRATELLVSCGQGEGSPEGFYQALGFQRNGQLEGNEVVLSLAV